MNLTYQICQNYLAATFQLLKFGIGRYVHLLAPRIHFKSPVKWILLTKFVKIIWLPLSSCWIFSWCSNLEQLLLSLASMCRLGGLGNCYKGNEDVAMRLHREESKVIPFCFGLALLRWMWWDKKSIREGYWPQHPCDCNHFFRRLWPSNINASKFQIGKRRK